MRSHEQFVFSTAAIFSTPSLFLLCCHLLEQLNISLEVNALNNALLIFLAFRHVYKRLTYCTLIKDHNAEKGFSVTMFGFEIKIMDKCCVCCKQLWWADCKRIRCEIKMSPCCFCSAYVTHMDCIETANRVCVNLVQQCLNQYGACVLVMRESRLYPRAMRMIHGSSNKKNCIPIMCGWVMGG